MKIGVLTMEKYDNRRKNSVGSSRIRAKWVMKYTPEMVEYENGEDYDVMIYQKAYYKDHMKAFKGIKIFDLCDPDWFEHRPVREMLEFVDAVTVPTQPLADYIKQMKPDIEVMVIPDRIDPEAHNVKKRIHRGPLRSVVWFGYIENAVCLNQVIEPLRDRNITLVCISSRMYMNADVNVKYDQDTVFEEIIKHDAVIMPTYDKSSRFMFKSNNKKLTSWALGMPVLVEYEDMDRFDDPLEREAEAKKRYSEVMSNYHVQQSGREYLELIERIKQKKG